MTLQKPHVRSESASIRDRVERRRLGAFSTIAALAVLLALAVALLTPWGGGDATSSILAAMGSGGLGALTLAFWAHAEQRRYLAFCAHKYDVAAALAAPSSDIMSGLLERLGATTANSEACEAYLSAWMPALDTHLDQLLDQEAQQERQARIAALCREADQMVKAAARRRHESRPDVRARMRLEQEIPHLRRLVQEADNQFNATLDKRRLKWWLKMTRDRSALEHVEDQIAALEVALERLKVSPSLVQADDEFIALNAMIDRRIAEAKAAAMGAVPSSRLIPFEPDHALSAGFVAGAVGGMASLVDDVAQAGAVYDALREVNGNYAEMSDFEIWLESLSMPTDSLIGLASLTKGAYFEKLVEHDFGGARFAEFNHPDTDIVIDGIAYQIKATDSASYINSVADHIPVIATSEIAETTGAIDGGYNNEELAEAIDLALGGTLIDVGDAVLDGVTTGLGGVGIVAILIGSHTAWKTYQETGDAAEALAIGIKTIAKRTARTLVNLAEIGVIGVSAVAKSKLVRVAWKAGREAFGAPANKAQQPQMPERLSYPKKARGARIDVHSDRTLFLPPKTS